MPVIIARALGPGHWLDFQACKLYIYLFYVCTLHCSCFFLAHLELVVNSNILLSVKVCHGDLQLVISLAGQSVEILKAKPALSLKIILIPY